MPGTAQRTLRGLLKSDLGLKFTMMRMRREFRLNCVLRVSLEPEHHYSSGPKPGQRAGIDTAKLAERQEGMERRQALMEHKSR